METTSSETGLSALTCGPCGIGSDELAAFSRHIDHLARTLAADEQRRLRAHLFALLAVTGRVDLRDGAEPAGNEYPLLTTDGGAGRSMSA